MGAQMSVRFKQGPLCQSGLKLQGTLPVRFGENPQKTNVMNSRSVVGCFLPTVKTKSFEQVLEGG